MVGQAFSSGMGRIVETRGIFRFQPIDDKRPVAGISLERPSPAAA